MGITKINKLPPEFYKIAKTDPIFPDWREDVANGGIHPLQMHLDEYMRLQIGILRIDHTFNQMQGGGCISALLEDETEAIKNFIVRPGVAWAVDISFDGLYVKKDADYVNMQTLFAFFVFLKTDQATFWKLKFSGT